MSGSAKLEVHFPMFTVSGLGIDTGATTFLRSQTQLNAADFDGNPLFYFEANINNTDASNDLQVFLIDTTNANQVMATLTGTKGVSSIYRSTAFTPNSGEVVYAVRTAQTVSINTLYVRQCRIVVVQDATATKTVISIPLIVSNYSNINSSDANTVYSGRSGLSTSYTQETSGYFYRFLKTASNWDTVSGCALDLCYSSSSGSATGTVGLVDIDNANAEVTSSSVGTTNTTITHAYQEFAWSAMTDTHQFELMGKSSNASYRAVIFNASLRIKMSSLAKGELYYLLNFTPAGTTAATSLGQTRVPVTTSNISNPVCYFEATGFCADNATVLELRATTSASASDGTEVSHPATEVNWNSATKARYRGTSCTPTDGYKLYPYVYASTAVQWCITCLVVAFTGTSGFTGITTAAITAIASTTATSGGTITGLTAAITDKGVCWNTGGAPTIADSHTHN